MKKYIKYILAMLLSFVWVNFGLFAGLQIAPIIGSVILFPLAIPAFLTGSGFGNFPFILQLTLYGATIWFWAWVGLRIWQRFFKRV